LIFYRETVALMGRSGFVAVHQIRIGPEGRWRGGHPVSVEATGAAAGIVR